MAKCPVCNAEKQAPECLACGASVEHQAYHAALVAELHQLKADFVDLIRIIRSPGLLTLDEWRSAIEAHAQRIFYRIDEEE